MSKQQKPKLEGKRLRKPFRPAKKEYTTKVIGPSALLMVLESTALPTNDEE